VPSQRSSRARLVIGWAAVSAGALVVARGAVALPEHCGDSVTAADAGAAASAAVDWFGRNQHEDGTWVYRYDVTDGTDLGGYNWIRHAGVLLSLYQAAAESVPGAAASADRGLQRVQSEIVELPGARAALSDGGELTSGGTALLVAALAERRAATGDRTYDALMRALGRYLVETVEPEGSVLESADVSGSLHPGSHSPFTTGEVFFALARLHLAFPDDQFAEPAERVARYVVTERADREGYVPDASDHWSAYGFATMRMWPERSGGLASSELGFARRQLGILSIQTRFETQRTNGGLSRWLRGRQALGAAIGTIGEAMGQWWDVAEREPRLAGQRAALRERITCMTGAIVDRQLSSSEAARTPQPEAAAGAFTQFGITQMDDQQHALSALLAAQRVLADVTPLPRRLPVPTNALLLGLAAIAALNPVRLGSGSRDRRWTDVAVAGAVVTGTCVLLAILGGPLLRTLDVSRGNGLVAAAIVLIGGGLYGLLSPDEEEPGGLMTPLIIPLALRPDLLILAIAAGAGGRGLPLALAVLAGAVLATAWTALTARRPVAPPLRRWLVRSIAAVGLATALALLVDGVYAI
jgi:hypothetical protein